MGFFDVPGRMIDQSPVRQHDTPAAGATTTVHATNDGDGMTNADRGQFQVLSTRSAALPDTERL
jgi:hypothetical protein